MRSIKNNNYGFTLVEVIISIAVLSLICGIVLKLFVLSNDVSKKSRIEDVASIYAMNVIEICKQVDAPSMALDHPFLQSAKVKRDDNLNFDGVIYFDDNWQPVDSQEVITNHTFELQLNVAKRQDEMLSSNKGALFDINVSIQQKNSKTGEYEQVIEYATSNYYVIKE